MSVDSKLQIAPAARRLAAAGRITDPLPRGSPNALLHRRESAAELLRYRTATAARRRAYRSTLGMRSVATRVSRNLDAPQRSGIVALRIRLGLALRQLEGFEGLRGTEERHRHGCPVAFKSFKLANLGVKLAKGRRRLFANVSGGSSKASTAPR